MNQRESNVDQFDGPIDGKWSILNGRSVAKLKGLRGWTKCDRPNSPRTVYYHSCFATLMQITVKFKEDSVLLSIQK